MSEEKLCGWWQDENCGIYQTGCNEAYEFIYDGVIDNKFKFCPFCGGEIKLQKGGE